MNILLLCWCDTTHPQGGGSERYLERVGEHLAARGHTVVYRTARHTGAPRVSTRAGVTYVRDGGRFSVYPLVGMKIAAGRLFGVGRMPRPDVIVDTQNGIPFFARLFSDAPVVVLTHHQHREQWPVIGRAAGRLGWFLESTVAPWLYRRDAYVTVSEASRDDLVGVGVGAGRIEIVENGVDPVPETVPTLADDGLIHLVTLSRLVPHKRIEHAMDALVQLRRTHPRVVLDIIGSGWWEDRLRTYADTRGVTDAVTFHGQVTEDYKHALLERATYTSCPRSRRGGGWRWSRPRSTACPPSATARRAGYAIPSATR